MAAATDNKGSWANESWEYLYELGAYFIWDFGFTDAVDSVENNGLLALARAIRAVHTTWPNVGYNTSAEHPLDEYEKALQKILEKTTWKEHVNQWLSSQKYLRDEEGKMRIELEDTDSLGPFHLHILLLVWASENSLTYRLGIISDLGRVVHADITSFPEEKYGPVVWVHTYDFEQWHPLEKNGFKNHINQTIPRVEYIVKSTLDACVAVVLRDALFESQDDIDVRKYEYNRGVFVYDRSRDHLPYNTLPLDEKIKVRRTIEGKQQEGYIERRKLGLVDRIPPSPTESTSTAPSYEPIPPRDPRLPPVDPRTLPPERQTPKRIPPRTGTSERRKRLEAQRKEEEARREEERKKEEEQLRVELERKRKREQDEEEQERKRRKLTEEDEKKKKAEKEQMKKAGKEKKAADDKKKAEKEQKEKAEKEQREKAEKEKKVVDDKKKAEKKKKEEEEKRKEQERIRKEAEDRARQQREQKNQDVIRPAGRQAVELLEEKDLIPLIMYYTTASRTHKMIDHHGKEKKLTNYPHRKLTYGRNQPMLHVLDPVDGDEQERVLVRDVFGREGLIPLAQLERIDEPWGIKERLRDGPIDPHRRSYIGNPHIKHRHLQVELARRRLPGFGSYDQLRKRLIESDIETQARRSHGIPLKISYGRMEPQGAWTGNMERFFGPGDTYPLSIDGPRREMHNNDGAYVRILQEWPDREIAVCMNVYKRLGQCHMRKQLRPVDDPWRIRVPAPQIPLPSPGSVFDHLNFDGDTPLNSALLADDPYGDIHLFDPSPNVGNWQYAWQP